MNPITLTEGQQNALNQFITFLASPLMQTFVLCGYAGTGKSTLIRELLDQYPALLKAVRLINPHSINYDLVLTATTNKAAEAMAQITGMEVKTIHSHLGLRVKTDYMTKTSELTWAKGRVTPLQQLIFIDEASFIDPALLSMIFKGVRDCKIVFIGDPAQLNPVKCSTTPVFSAGFPTAMLTEVVRQAKGNPIIELATAFRETVSTGKFFSFTPDGEHIQYLSRDDFNQAVLDEFTRPDWKFNDSKVLAWTNGCVIEYNKAIQNHTKGRVQFAPGDYAINNTFISVGARSLKTDQLVYISCVGGDTERLGVKGNIHVADGIEVFMAHDREDVKKRLVQAQLDGDYSAAQAIASWADLRAASACTINKSQGSTYNKVFIDLDDVKRCTNGNSLARLLYVATSRARNQVVFTGDLV